MSAEFDNDLTANQWEALRSLRLSSSGALKSGTLNRFTVESLIALELAAMAGDRPVLTPKGRTVLVRGSSRLLDVAA
jgi:hypothetical protein